MTDFRHDILGPNGLSTESETFTMKSTAIELSNDISISEQTLSGKNLFHNGKPVQTWDDSDSLNGWTRASTNVSNVVYNTVGNEYFSIKFTATAAETNSGAVQFTKEYKRNGAVYLNGTHGGEIKDVISGSTCTVGLEVKANQKINVQTKFCIQYQDSTPTLDFGTFTEVVEPSENWEKLSFNVKFPDNYQTLIEEPNVKNVKWFIQFNIANPVTEDIPDVEYYFRNVQMEYGTEASDFMLSDWDKDYVIENGVPVSGTIQITENGNGIDVSNYKYAKVNVSNPDTYTTATLTLTAKMYWYGIRGTYYAPILSSNGITTKIDTSSGGTSVTVNVLLYNGKAVLKFFSSGSAISNLSGNITAIDDETYLITGNCQASAS